MPATSDPPRSREATISYPILDRKRKTKSPGSSQIRCQQNTLVRNHSIDANDVIESTLLSTCVASQLGLIAVLGRGLIEKLVRWSEPMLWHDGTMLQHQR